MASRTVNVEGGNTQYYVVALPFAHAYIVSMGCGFYHTYASGYNRKSGDLVKTKRSQGTSRLQGKVDTSLEGGALLIPNVSDANNQGGGLHRWGHSDGTLQYMDRALAIYHTMPNFEAYNVHCFHRMFQNREK